MQDLNNRFTDKYTSKTVKCAGKNIILLGFVKSDGTRGLLKICGMMNSQKTKEALVTTLFPHMFLGEKRQQDNAPCHFSTETLTYFNENCVVVIKILPSQAPNLNVIQYLWAYDVAKRVFKASPKNLEAFWSVVMELPFTK